MVELARTAEQREAILNDPDKLKSLMEDPKKFAEWSLDSAKAQLEADMSIERQIEAEHEKVEAKIKAEVVEELKEQFGLKNLRQNAKIGHLPTSTERDKGHKHNADAPGAALDGEFKNVVDFMQAVQRVKAGGVDTRIKALNESQGDQGGFLVPEEFRATLMAMSLEASVVRPRATVIPMSSLVVNIPTVRDTTHASSVYGGIIGYWTNEGGSITQTDPTFSQVRLEAKKLTGSTRISNELMADSAISVEGIVNQLYPAAISWFEDDAFINGTGAGQPTGVLNANAMVSVAKETGQAANTVVWENIVKMYSRMHPSGYANAVFYANPDVFPQLATMSLSVGTGGSAVWLNNGVAGPPATILGRPVVLTEKAQTVGTAGDIVFADFSQYLIGDRQSMSMASSEHSRFLNDQTEWRVIQRVDGRAWLDSAITPANGTNTLSPFVNVAVRA